MKRLHKKSTRSFPGAFGRIIKNLSEFFADHPADETLDLEGGSDLGKGGFVIQDPGLVHQTDFRVEAVDFTGEDLFEHFSRLAGEFGIGGGSDLFFLGDDSFGISQLQT